MMRFLVPAITALSVSCPVSAAPYFQDGYCALIVASRPSIQEARSYIVENGWTRSASVFESQNGWFAIGVDLVALDRAKGVLDARKASGLYPQDAYCSTGQQYLRSVQWQSTPDRDSSRPVSAGLWSEFDARPMAKDEKRFLQAALAMAGRYNGLLDGVWGNGSQSALERYSRAEFEIDKPANAHAAYLAGVTISRWLEEGWEYQHVRYLDISMMLPVSHLELIKENGQYEQWRHRTKDLEVLFNDLSNADMSRLHQSAPRQSDVVGDPYTLRRSDRWVTSVRTTTGTVYMRSDLIAGTWSTVVILAGSGLEGDVGLITSSMRAGSPSDIVPQESGVLLTYADELFRELEEDSIEPAAPAPGAGLTRSDPPSSDNYEGSEGGTGTAFFVNHDGVALTNAHVVEGCSSVSLGGKPAEIVSVSSTFDLAALRLTVPEETTPLRFSQGDATLNSDITIAGYPLHGILGGLNVSRGSVSSMKGLQGDETSIQISAPVQPGNSGGPAIDRYGGVVAVVVAKLDTVALADVTGDIAQNVNFAIRGSLAKVFLSSNGIDYEENTLGDPVAPEKAAELLQTSTQLVECSG